MTTRILVGRDAVLEAAAVLRAGGIAAIPTETVYGLAANAFDEEACSCIFAAKGRPSDNPLIVHIADVEQVSLVCDAVPENAKKLMDAFWPGPLSIVLPKSSRVPDIVSAGLPTVAVRMPSSMLARAIIRAAGVPLAAPSANRSGRPSPTDAWHVLKDMHGRIPIIADGGPCTVGVESTVVDLTGGDVVILRPGGVSEDEVAAVTGSVRRHSGETDDRPASPGMKYRHYAPRARVVVAGPSEGAAPIAENIRTLYHTHKEKGGHPTVLCLAADLEMYSGLSVRSLGSGRTEAAHAIFRELREADERGCDLVLIHAEEAMGSAVLDRIMRAAGRG